MSDMRGDLLFRHKIDKWLLLMIALYSTAFLQRVVSAQPDAPSVPAPHTYAVVVGSNPGGEGQDTLKFAEQDAGRVAELLGELGRYRSENVRLLLRPEPEQVFGTLEALAEPLGAHRKAGEQAVLFFYYSGHARAKSMNLGQRELLLSELRETLLSLPTTLTVVVLDACQSGAFSRTKGAAPAADFSFNSVSRLNTSGIAVMASSSASELSQESDVLGASYFTHHLLVALRGGGDKNQDGRVSLDEAYRYAHDHTLADTSRTAVGGQHPTLQTDLTGRGDVPLTYPAEAKAQLELPKELSGQILIQKPSGGAVMAELYKASGRALLLALPAGRYDIVLRGNIKGESTVRQCSIELSDNQVTRFRTEQCPQVTVAPAQPKGTPAHSALKDTALDRPRDHERLAVELSAGAAFINDDAYIARLRDFGFDAPAQLSVSLRYSLLGLYQFNRYFGLALQLQLLEAYPTTDGGSFTTSEKVDVSKTVDYVYPKAFVWETYAVTFLPRGTLPLLDGRIALYAQLGLGLGFGFAQFHGIKSESKEGFTDIKNHLGFRLTAGGGIQVNFGRYLGLFFDSSYDYAPIIHSLKGETHNSGGLFIGAGLRARIWI